MAPGIRNRNIAKGSAARTITSSFWDLFVNVTGTYHLTTASLAAGVGGSPAGFAAFYTKACQSIFLTPVIAVGTGTLVLRVNGENQFGDPVFETFSWANGAAAVQTTFCYRRITGLTIVSFSGAAPTGADTLSVGYSLVGPRIPIMAMLKAATSIKAVANVNQVTLASQPTFTAALHPTWAITLVGGTIVASTNGCAQLHVTLDPNDPLL